MENNRKERDKKYREQEHIKRKAKEKYSTLEGRFVHWRAGAKKRGLEFSITIDDLKNYKLKCYYTGRELTYEPHQLNTVSLDRIDSNKGYTKDNVVFCCDCVNVGKSDLALEEFVKMCCDVYVLYKKRNKF